MRALGLLVIMGGALATAYGVAVFWAVHTLIWQPLSAFVDWWLEGRRARALGLGIPWLVVTTVWVTAVLYVVVVVAVGNIAKALGIE